MPRPSLSRADLPPEFTPESLRAVPVHVLRAFQRRDNGVLSPEEQQDFDRALHAMMRQIAARIHLQLDRTTWDVPAGRAGRRLSDIDVQRIARRIEAQLNSVEGLAPELDWARLVPPAVAEEASTPSASSTAPTPGESVGRQPSPGTPPTADHQTLSEVEATINDQVDLLAVMTDIAEVNRRTYALEQQREAANTRSVFFGFLVSVAVIVAGWAPLVTAGWPERLWILGLTIVTCVLAGGVYALVRRHQKAIEKPED